MATFETEETLQSPDTIERNEVYCGKREGKPRKDWKRRYWGDATPERDDPAEEIRALRAELARVREQRDILKKTLGIFTEPSRSATKASNT
jgi:transposase-like protein